jgi:hypothetical protein
MEHLSCQITIAALSAALSGSIGLNAALGRKVVQQGSMLTKLASASALLNEKLIERMSIRDPRSRLSSSSHDSQSPSSET